MAVAGFTTNNLVKEHDMYIDFLKKRNDYVKENSADIFDKNVIIPEGFKYFGESWSKHQAERVNIIKWHSILLTYDIWCKCVKDYTVSSPILYKRQVSIPLGVLRSFKARVEEALKESGPNYNNYIHKRSPFDACRYLAIFWTYLDIVKDTKTQRFFPDKATREGAAKVFGYQDGENPFEMNGKYFHTNKEKTVKEETTKYNLNLDASIDEFDFTTRTRNGLWRAGYRKLGDIINLKYENLIKIRNLGLVSTKEVLEKLNEIKSQSESVRIPDPKRIKVSENETPFDTKNNESVIDIAEQAAKEVSEEKDLKYVEYAEDHINMVHPYDYNSLLEKFNKLKNDYDELDAKCDTLKKKYADLLETSRTQCDKYDELLKQKLELETCIPRLKDDIHVLKEENQELKAQNSRLRVVSDPSNLDTFTLLNTVLEKMKHSKMEYILLTIDGITVDIHPAKSFPLKTDYQIRSSEVR